MIFIIIFIIVLILSCLTIIFYINASNNNIKGCTGDFCKPIQKLCYGANCKVGTCKGISCSASDCYGENCKAGNCIGENCRAGDCYGYGCQPGICFDPKCPQSTCPQVNKRCRDGKAFRLDDVNLIFIGKNRCNNYITIDDIDNKRLDDIGIKLFCYKDNKDNKNYCIPPSFMKNKEYVKSNDINNIIKISPTIYKNKNCEICIDSKCKKFMPFHKINYGHNIVQWK